jgi:hypothetical protein
MDLITALLEVDEPTIRYKTHVHVLGEKTTTKSNRTRRAEIANSARVKALLSERKKDGTIPHSAYAKWDGAHWVLYALAELEYPAGDDSLLPLREQVLDYLFSPGFTRGIRQIKGVTRIHASIPANAVWFLHFLGLADERVDKLVTLLHETQWRDGGWNCDPRATGNTSSFYESLLPLRALDLHARVTGDNRARAAADRCAEFFLSRHLYKRIHGGQVITKHFVTLHYPCYWHYDILLGLRVMREGGRLDDPRCRDALDLLEAKQLENDGWRAEASFYRHSNIRGAGGRSLTGWGPTGKKTRNDFVTVDALAVLNAAGRNATRTVKERETLRGHR